MLTILLGTTDKAIKQEKDMRHKYWKEKIKLQAFAADIKIYLENSREEFGKIFRYDINVKIQHDFQRSSMSQDDTRHKGHPAQNGIEQRSCCGFGFSH